MAYTRRDETIRGDIQASLRDTFRYNSRGCEGIVFGNELRSNCLGPCGLFVVGA